MSDFTRRYFRVSTAFISLAVLVYRVQGGAFPSLPSIPSMEDVTVSWAAQVNTLFVVCLHCQNTGSRELSAFVLLHCCRQCIREGAAMLPDEGLQSRKAKQSKVSHLHTRMLAVTRSMKLSFFFNSFPLSLSHTHTINVRTVSTHKGTHTYDLSHTHTWNTADSAARADASILTLSAVIGLVLF